MLFVIACLNIDKLAKKSKMGWLSQNRQIQGAQISRNEAYLGTLQ
jgi:hypothetical protein